MVSKRYFKFLVFCLFCSFFYVSNLNGLNYSSFTLRRVRPVLQVVSTPLNNPQWPQLGVVVGRDVAVWVRDSAQFPQEPYFIMGINHHPTPLEGKVTITVIKGDMGSIAGHTKAPGDMLEAVALECYKAMREGKIISFAVTACGDDIEIILSHNKGELNPEIHNLGQEAMKKAIAVAEELNCYGAGQDMLVTANVGNVAGAGLGVAEMSFVPRKGEQITVIMADKMSTASFGLPVFRLVTDPSVNPGLLAKAAMSQGFTVEVWNVKTGQRVFLNSLHDQWILQGLLAPMHEWVVKRVFTTDAAGKLAHEPLITLTTTVLSEVREATTGTREYIGKDDPAGIFRSQGVFPPQGSITEAFKRPFLVTGWMMGGQFGAPYLTGLRDAIIGAFDGPPLIAGISFQVDLYGRLVAPQDQFGLPSFDTQREWALRENEFLRQLAQFLPGSLPPEYMEYPVPPKSVMDALALRLEPILPEERGFESVRDAKK